MTDVTPVPKPAPRPAKARKVLPKKRATKVATIKRRCDLLASLIVRAEGKCQMCGVACPCETFPRAHRQGCPLTCSHFVGRTANWTRTYEDNLTCLCFSCHAKVEGNPPRHVEWFRGLRGDDVVRECQRRGEMTALAKFDWPTEELRLIAVAEELGVL